MDAIHFRDGLLRDDKRFYCHDCKCDQDTFLEPKPQKLKVTRKDDMKGFVVKMLVTRRCEVCKGTKLGISFIVEVKE